jgi:hypothetical protein
LSDRRIEARHENAAHHPVIVTKSLRDLRKSRQSGKNKINCLDSIMKKLLLGLLILVGIANVSVQAKKAWNGPDLHGVNTEATHSKNLESQKSNPE